ncbi:MAG: hypothetical protein QXN87_04590 [Candidatus Bathyarchaeia archaeon]
MLLPFQDMRKMQSELVDITSKLKEKYLEKWIAVFNQAAFHHDRDLGKLARMLRKSHFAA